MIVAEQKPLEEIRDLIDEASNVLVVGCGTCVTVCFAGGEKEADILATSLRMKTKLDGEPKDVTHTTVQRQCEWEYIDPLNDQIGEVDAVITVGHPDPAGSPPLEIRALVVRPVEQVDLTVSNDGRRVVNVLLLPADHLAPNGTVKSRIRRRS